MPGSPPQLDAIILGAGWSGLTSALQLSKAGKKVLCLEARKRLGGRAFTHSWNEKTAMENNDRVLPANEQGYTVDFGCSYIHGYEEGNPVKEIAKRYGTNVFVSKPTTMQIVGDNGVLPKSINDTLQANLGAAQAAARVHAKQLRQSSNSSVSSSSSSTKALSSFLFDENQSPLFVNLTSVEERRQAVNFSRLLHIPLGVDIEQISLEHFGYEENFAGTDGMPEGGFTKLIEALAKDVKENGGEIQLGKTVAKISQLPSGNGVQVEVMDSDNSQGSSQTLQAKTTIVTAPLAVLQRQQQPPTSKGLQFDPALDGATREAIEKTTIGNLNKVLLSYKQPWWSLDTGTFVVLPSEKKKEEGFNSSSSSLDAKTASALYDLFASTTLIVNSLCTANTGLPSSLTSPSLLVMIGAAPAKQLEQFSRLDVAQALDDYLAPRLPRADGNSSSSKKERRAPLQHSFYSRWARQDFTGGATTTPVTIGNTPAYFSQLAKPLWNGTLYLAGEHCEPNHRGSIAGSVVSAQTTSDLLLRHLATSSTEVSSTAARH